jgi:hypothetical protein
MAEQPRFVCGYRGATDYVYKGRKYVVRCFACPGPGATPTSEDGYYNGDYYRTGILPSVGTVMCDDSEHRHDYPPADVLAYFPNHVGARWRPDFSAVDYIGGIRPATFTTPWGDVTTPAIWAERFPERQTA